MKTTMKKDHVFYFGKYEGKTVQEVLDTDIEYIRWLEKEKGIKFEDAFLQQLNSEEKM